MLGTLKPYLQQNLFKTRLTALIKIYSLHEPQVACIAKGKSVKAYAFGAKVALVRGRKTGVTSVNGWRYNGPTSRHWIQFEDEIKPNQTTNSFFARTCSPTIFMQI
jgi:hypothetical protein